RPGLPVAVTNSQRSLGSVPYRLPWDGDKGVLFMRKYRKWVLTLGIVAAAPGVTMAGPFDLFKSKSAETAAAPAAGGNQKVAEEIAAALRKANFSGYDVEIEYRNGVAMLAGKVGTLQQKMEATRVVAQVPGVQRVDNQ